MRLRIRYRHWTPLDRSASGWHEIEMSSWMETNGKEPTAMGEVGFKYLCTSDAMRLDARRRGTEVACVDEEE